MMAILPGGAVWDESAPGKVWTGLFAAEKRLKLFIQIAHKDDESVGNLSEVYGIKYDFYKLGKKIRNCFHRPRLGMAHEKFFCQRRG